ncbi:penicillin acylase family protein [Balneolales bacterium ANBcel1]|nr:penicillin acylase family protein [Balneolales bacterium ANBcel1]
MLRAVKIGISLGLALLITWAASTRHGTIPAMGPLLNPFTGFWQNMERGEPPVLVVESDLLHDEVTVIYDQRLVPHIFAANDHDLYFAQGYVTARDRLWQIEFQTRAAAGTLSEVLGDVTLEYDRGQRRLGMLYGAENQLEFMKQEPEYYDLLQAYADGVNAWIDQLRPADYPVEYKILGGSPQNYEPLHSALMVMNIAVPLTAVSHAHAQSNMRAMLDKQTYRLLFPERLPWAEPMIPDGTTMPTDPIRKDPPQTEFIPRVTRDLPLPDVPPGAGSNAWVVDGTRTASGYPILANDPHLSITFPSIWYEIHLNSEGVNTYGYSIPGTQAITIGFNEHYAWGITSGTSASLDVYEIQFRDEHKTEYLHDGEWKPVRRRVEEIRVKGGETVRDTILYTHHGPVVQAESGRVMENQFPLRQFPSGHAIQWIAHTPANPLKSMYLINRGTGLESFEEGVRHFENINLNFLYADRDGNISGGHYGRLPVRFPGQGRYISDGSDPAYDWDAFIPFEHLPRSVNPGNGYIVNTNQVPATEEYPYYLGLYYADFSRPNRVRQLLEQIADITPADFQNMMTDDYSLLSRYILTPVLPCLDRSGMTEAQRRMTDYLEAWDFRFSLDSRAAGFFEQWMLDLRSALWAPAIDPLEQAEYNFLRPNLGQLAWQLNELPREQFPVDVSETVNNTFNQAFDAFIEEHGTDPAGWEYRKTRVFTAGHLAFIPGFGRDDVAMPGTFHAINAAHNRFAPSMRMVVETGPVMKAFGSYSGGQSGNPGNPNYDSHYDDWPDGTLYELNFWRSPEEAGEQEVSRITLRP